MIFIVATFVILNLIVSGLLHLDSNSLGQVQQAVDKIDQTCEHRLLVGQLTAHFISSIAFCILAFSGVESVIQTAGWCEAGGRSAKPIFFWP